MLPRVLDLTVLDLTELDLTELDLTGGPVIRGSDPDGKSGSDPA
jgi:hypothetical protein